MIILAVCTEGDNSEPNYIESLKSVMFGTSPADHTNLEIVPVPLGGNQGFKKVFEKAEMALEERRGDDGSILSLISEDDILEKWLIIDYDKMERCGVSEEWMRSEAVRMGYEIIINKPNFEFFILCHFVSVVEASKVLPKDLKDRINIEIKKYNTAKGYNKEEFVALKLPNYSKKGHQSRDLFWRLLDQNLNSLETLVSRLRDCSMLEARSDMWKIIIRLQRVGLEEK